MADKATARELRGAIKYERGQQKLDKTAATHEGRRAIDEAAMMARLGKLSKVEESTANALERLAGTESARLAALVTKVRTESAIALEQQRQAKQLRKKGAMKLAHALEHIA